MKRLTTVVLTLSFLVSTNSAWASNFAAHCPDRENSLEDCKINIQGARLSIEYDSGEDQDLNVDISKKQITALSYGTYAKRRLKTAGIATTLLGPVGLFGLLRIVD